MNQPTADRIADLLKAAGPRTAVPDEPAARVRAAVEAHWRGRRTRTARLSWALAASLATAVVGGFAYYSASRPAAGASIASVAAIVGEPALGGRVLAVAQPLSVGATLRTRPGELIALRMADGRGLRVAPESALRLHDVTRVELLAGRVYLDTPPGVRGALELETRFGTVTDLGTQYEAAVREDGAALRIRVREGAVQLDGARHEERLGVGEELTVVADGTASRGRVAPPDAQWEWTSAVAPRFELDGESVDALARWVARERGYALRYDSPATEVLARGATLHGAALDVGPGAALGVVLPATRFIHAIDGQTLLISSRDER